MTQTLSFMPDTMFLMKSDLTTNQLLQEQSITQILECNKDTAEYQLTLSREEAILLIDTRREALKATQRIEIGGGTIYKLIECFKDSPYLIQDNYAAVMSELIDTFYYFKNETLDEISDDELIACMKELFDEKCGGSIELLQGRELESIAHHIRFGTYEEDEESEEEC